ncbi:MAG: superoxide dismutase family protein [Chlorogloeopsis fritschii C42_A2020_084]|nr:superoxide dismutase family protein [Chlorogloeopsis fritschii C42_A2020_084]
MSRVSLFKSLLLFGVSLCLVLVCELAWGKPSVQPNLLQAQARIAGTGINGVLILTQEGNESVHIRGHIQGNPDKLTPGLHGFHIHSVGVCEPNAQPPFVTSGGHFDPGPSGSELPVEAKHPYHVGDLPNLVVDGQGNAIYDAVTDKVTLSDGLFSLFDSNGSAFIIHQLPDKQQANGTAADAGGGRIACGVITRNI